MLNNNEISDEDYEHAQKVLKHFDMKTMRDYHILYLKLDVLFLTDVFENFRDMCMETYKLDACWYLTVRRLAWSAAFKIIEVQLKLLSDPDTLLMIEKGIRGGVSIISTRYSTSNSKFTKYYNSDEKSKFIQYLDANNLYW